MNSTNKVAIITRTKNRVLLLHRAVRSVLCQTFDNWQHVIVNDGGDASPVDELVNRYSDQYKGRLTVIHNGQSRGMEAASNIGLAASESRFVVIHDDDDSWEPEFLEYSIEAYEKCRIPSVRGVVTHINQIFEKIDGDTVKEERRQIYDPEFVSLSIPQISEINRYLPISFLFEREVFDVIGTYDENLPVIGDWDFNFRFLLKYDVLIVKESLANYHIRTNAPESYENTVTAGKDAHLYYRALLVNKHIRDDLENGRISGGLLLAYGDYFHRSSGGIWRLTRLLDKFKSLPGVSFLRKTIKK